MEKERQTYCIIAQFEATEGFSTLSLTAGLSDEEVEQLVHSSTIVKSEITLHSVTGKKYTYEIPELIHRCVKVLSEDDV